MAVLDDSGDALRVKIICRVVVAICDYRDLLTDIVIEPTVVARVDSTQKWLFI